MNSPKKAHNATHLIHAQRKSHDCGVAALAALIGSSYEDMYVAAIASSDTFAKRDGLTIADMVRMAAGFGRRLVPVNCRHVDLEEDIGVLGVNWHKSQWQRHGATGHWVLLRQGTIIDPVGPSYGDALDYLAVNKGRAGTLLKEA